MFQVRERFRVQAAQRALHHARTHHCMAAWASLCSLTHLSYCWKLQHSGCHAYPNAKTAALFHRPPYLPSKAHKVVKGPRRYFKLHTQQLAFARLCSHIRLQCITRAFSQTVVALYASEHLLITHQTILLPAGKTHLSGASKFP